VSDDLRVHLNSDERHAIEPVESSLAVAEGFEVIIENHGDASHVNIGLGGDLAAGGAVATPNPFVPTEETIRIAVDITTAHRPLEGVLTISTGYGQTRVELPISVVTPQQTGVDAAPTPKRANGSGTGETVPLSDLQNLVDSFDDPGTIALVALGVLALVLAVATALLIDSLVVVLAVILVVLAVTGSVAIGLQS